MYIKYTIQNGSHVFIRLYLKLLTIVQCIIKVTIIIQKTLYIDIILLIFYNKTYNYILRYYYSIDPIFNTLKS
ncbi:hypothetical protein AN1V17_40420 [Vallitalea sediminicola]